MSNPMSKQQSTSYWDIARLSKLPGAQIAAEVNPSAWTVRTRNAVKRMMQRGRITGGWSSVSAALARAVADQYEVPVSKSYSSSHLAVTDLTAEQKVALSDLIKADLVQARLDGSYHGRHTDLEGLLNYMNETGRINNYYFHVQQFANQAYDLIAKTLPESTKERARVACEAIDNNETIYITIK